MSDLLYQNEDISVDQHFARFGQKSYAIDKVNSVEIRTEKATKLVFAILLIFSIGFGLASSSNPSTTNVVGFLLFIGLAYLAHKNPPKDNHKLFLMTSSSEAQAFETKDEDEVNRLRRAIEQAMTNTPV